MTIARTDPIDDRAEPRDEVHFRSSVVLADQRRLPALVVNLSPSGLMIRCDAPVAAGEWLWIRLPAIGDVRVAVRWALGGRIGCLMERPIPANRYHAVLGAMAG
ncbi:MULTISPECIES: PilZ domain-containing protein [unclassified Sphingomonas]|uniref:PilZ domain-containing protein n=1 Tax=unclassified Sphingomonas TaxID=196159 RepID=UPI0004477184|nr:MULTISPECIES: PilZ domain-containing protein [unclassified Sphingomonas]EZP52804.1 Type IV pilus assembly PilZ [Sphingomonas sp. RIT328]